MARGARRAAKRRARPCRVYWGGHGCKKIRGHWGIHVCLCGDILRITSETADIVIYGEDWSNDAD